MNRAVRRVALLDSGLGGLTVLSALRKALPDVDVIYFADTARVPYGDRPLWEVAAFGRQIIDRLRGYEPAAVIIASGTTCAAFESVDYNPSDLLLLGVVECGAGVAVDRSPSGRIGVVATQATSDSGIFERKLKERKPDVRVTSLGAPRLVPIVEAGAWATELARDAVEEAVAPLRDARCDAVILGCTHFPHLLPWFARSLGNNVTIVDPGIACAQAAAESVSKLAPGQGHLTFEVSGDAEQFASFALQLGVRAAVTRHVNFSD